MERLVEVAFGALVALKALGAMLELPEKRLHLQKLVKKASEAFPGPKVLSEVRY